MKNKIHINIDDRNVSERIGLIMGHTERLKVELGIMIGDEATFRFVQMGYHMLYCILNILYCHSHLEHADANTVLTELNSIFEVVKRDLIKAEKTIKEEIELHIKNCTSPDCNVGSHSKH